MKYFTTVSISSSAVYNMRVLFLFIAELFAIISRRSVSLVRERAADLLRDLILSIINFKLLFVGFSFKLSLFS